MTRALRSKLSLNFSGKEPGDWYWLDDKRVFKVTLTNVHGSKNLSIGAAAKLRNSLMLDEEGLKRLYNCPMRRKEYENKIRGMGIV